MTAPPAIRRYGRDLGILAAAVLVGGIGAALASRLADPLLSPGAGRNAALAVATTLTAATHARLAHRQAWHVLLPSLLLNGPLVYLVMRGVHTLVGR